MQGVRDRIPVATDMDAVALIFGLDEVKIDWANSRIKFPEMGWVKTNQPSSTFGKFEWVALIYNRDQWQVILSDAPLFSPSVSPALPMKDGVFMAWPAARHREMRHQMMAAEAESAKKTSA